jgi:hypothetical protein
MKKLLFQALMLASVIFVSCSGKDSKTPPDKTEPDNELTGAWLLISGKYYTPDRDSLLAEVNSPQEPTSIKVFSYGHFAYIAKGSDGLNTAGSAGPYRIEDDKYIETHDWLGGSYDQRFLGSTSTYRFKIKGDTLFMSGTLKSVGKNGEEIKDHIQMDEIRIRIKENKPN